MAIVTMADAVSGQTAKAAEYNKVTANIRDLDARLGAVVSTNTAHSRLSSLELLTGASGLTAAGNNALSSRLGTGVTTSNTATSQLDALDGRLDALEASTGSSVQMIVKALNESVTSSTTLQNDNDFAFAVEANAKYIWEGYWAYDGAGAGNGVGIKVDFTFPSGSSGRWSNRAANATGNVESIDVVSQALGTASPRGMGTHTITLSANPSGFLQVGATAGTFQMRWAQVTSNATTFTILAGSWMRLTKVS